MSKAQDKIYFDQHSAHYNNDKRNNDDIEYIRKNALLEWAKEKLKTIKWYTKTMSPVTRGGCAENYGKADAFQELIDKINSL